MGTLRARIASVVVVPLLVILSVVLYVYGSRWGICIVVLVVITVLLCINSRRPPLTDDRTADGGAALGRGAGEEGILPVQQQQQQAPPVTQLGSGGGLDASTIAALPAYAYGKKKASAVDAGDGDDCAVCLGELQLGETVKQLPACAHLFHDGCVDAWLRSHVTCPVCRFPVADTTALPAVAGIVRGA